ncbi:hypothetical protein Hte_008063 [Hypoxylon texense]
MNKHEKSKPDSSNIVSSQVKSDDKTYRAAPAQSAGDRNEAALSSAGQQNVGIGTGSQSGNHGGSTGSGGG